MGEIILYLTVGPKTKYDIRSLISDLMINFILTVSLLHSL